MIIEPTDHLDHQCDSTLQPSDAGLKITIQPPDYLQLSPQFLSRASGVYEKPSEFRDCPASATLRYVGWDRCRCPYELIDSACYAWSGEIVREPGDVHGDRGSELVNQQTTHMSPNDHPPV